MLPPLQQLSKREKLQASGNLNVETTKLDEKGKITLTNVGENLISFHRCVLLVCNFHQKKRVLSSSQTHTCLPDIKHVQLFLFIDFT